MNIARFLALSVLSCLILLAACGGDGDDDTNDGDFGQPTASAGATTGDDDQPTASAGATDDAKPTGDDEPDATDEPAGGNGSSIDVCSLLTPEEVAEVIGEPVEAAEADAFNSNAGACEWTSTDSLNSVLIEVLTDNGKNWFDTLNFGQEDEPVEGVGDEANIDFIGVLDVVQGDVFVSVQPILFLSDVDDQEAAVTLAQMVLNRIE